MVIAADRACPDRFYKYSSAAGVLAMLGNLSIWWKSPPLFNDPFDTQLKLNIGCTIEAIAQAGVPMFEALIYSSDALAPTMPEAVKAAVLEERSRATPENRHTLQAGLLQGLNTQLGKIQAALDDGQIKWTAFLDSMRVLCLSEVNDDILMWSHYAQRHQGAVLGLRPLPGVTAWEIEPIIYTGEIPVMASAEQWIAHVLNIKLIDFESFFHSFAFSKSAHWAYEREWRCRILDANPNLDVPGEPLVWAGGLRADQVAAVYLGCRISDTDRAAILGKSQAKVPHAEVYQAVQRSTRFGLDFERIR